METGIRYLGISISLDMSTLEDDNLEFLVNKIKNVLVHWVNLKLSWMSRISTVKMKVLLKLSFSEHDNGDSSQMVAKDTADVK